MKAILIASLLTAFSQFAHANLYRCEDATSEPKKVTEAPKEVLTTFAKPYLFNDVGNVLNTQIKKLKPFLVYYVVDSAEPFMQYSVKFELAQLRRSCENDSNVNFIAFLNSMYVEKNEFVLCKNQKFERLNFDNFPQIDTSLKIKRKHIIEDDHTTGELGPMSYLVQYEHHINKVFGEFPFAHPDFVYDLFALAIEDENLFPSKEYIPFINLKSHGSRMNILSGLQPCQLKAKTETQKVLIGKILSEKEIQFLNEADFDKELTKVNELLEKLVLGSSKGVGGDSNLGGMHLGGMHLGGMHLGGMHLSDAVAGLGANNGLGAEFSFGLIHSGLSSILSHLFNEDSKNTLGFVMLESCDTNRNFKFHQTYMENVMGIYSAQHSLWYRNLNWWSLLKEANGSANRLVELLKIHTADIENYSLKD